MIRRSLLSGLALVAELAASSAQFDSKRWAHFTTVEAPAAASGYAEARLDAGAYRHTRSSLADLRVTTSSGEEVPYVLRERVPAAPARAEVLARMINRAVTPRGELQFVLDFGASKPLHNSLRLEWTETDFRRPLKLESSADRENWDLVKEAMLLDFRQDGLLFQTREVAYPESGQRYLRVTIGDWGDPSTLAAAASERRPVEQREYTEIASPVLRPSPAEPGEGKGDAAFRFELPFSIPSPLRLEILAESGEFVRQVEVQSRSREGRWLPACYGTIASVAGTVSNHLECSSPGSTELRLVVRNRDNTPIRVAGVRVLVPARSILFPVSASDLFRLYAGNPSAGPPQYDIESVLARSPRVEPVAARLAGWQVNPVYQPPPPPLSERMRDYLAPLLAAVVILIAVAAAFLIRQSKASV